ncbi:MULTISPECIES: hypothetical protein [unclassified Spirosoma]|uniref:hypothetical protein n=1 Tax=unclassified Spirosoma TaxID=2621999 RepID=UPI000967E3B5|nr:MULTISPECIES: hypothetical protein [unclassified Spirosoma]MBN8822947.1 hypothetical protein [Spirosoma sp.]OJW80130.1 MAG: hypothetical protein BGO59_02705 [Spirosoma sp. 48-14]
MKSLFIIAILFVGISGQAFSMGHPHNMFAARKQLRAKASTSVAKTKLCPPVTTWQRAVQATQNSLTEQVLVALSRVNPLQSR